VAWRKTSATAGQFTVSAPSSNGGNAVKRIEYQLSGSQTDNGSRQSWPFTINVGGGHDRSYQLQARACNDAGCGSWASASGSTDPAPNPTARVSRGDAVSNGNCWDASCARFKVNYTDFPSGSHRVECWSDTNASTSGWHNIVDNSRSPGGAGQTVSYGGSGSFQMNCYYGDPGTSVAVVIDGTRYQASTW
jgi:large repetitive protein